MKIYASFINNRIKILEKNLRKRGFGFFFASTTEELHIHIKEIIEENSIVSWGGSVTLEETGIKELLRNGNYNILDREQAESPEEIEEIYHKALSADFYLMSTSAISLDGQLVNIDGRGNRLAALIYGPRKVIIITGYNKITSTLEEAMARLKNTAAPLNAIRLHKKTPCTKETICRDCLGQDSICSHTVITRRSVPEGRIHIVMLGEESGL
ncbi:lactate utilization protein [Spirochaetia bacterium 38H-sp]|uniref:Lactate utilization protein n=1 Tax=Rarispira pelagica TaxID=3141764 RepID=A0ABU9U9U6_9SPIR